MTIGIGNQYLETKIQTATPEVLVGMLYEGAIRFMKQAVSEMENNDWATATTNIVKAQNIVSELNITLDKSKGGEVAENLAKIYDYLNNRLIEANIKKDPSCINECASLVSDLNAAWSEVIKHARTENKEGLSLAG